MAQAEGAGPRQMHSCAWSEMCRVGRGVMVPALRISISQRVFTAWISMHSRPGSSGRRQRVCVGSVCDCAAVRNNCC